METNSIIFLAKTFTIILKMSIFDSFTVFIELAIRFGFYGRTFLKKNQFFLEGDGQIVIGP